MHTLSGILLAAMLAILPLGCSEQAEVNTTPKRSRPQPPSAPVQEKASEIPFHYKAEGKRDPFASYVLHMREVELKSRATQTTPLERFDLTQLQVQAIVWGTRQPRALVLDPSGKSYVIAVGTPIGKNGGRVIRISDNMIRVKETYVDFRGRATTKDIDMRLANTALGGS